MFYNPNMVLDRDLGVAFALALVRLRALAADGTCSRRPGSAGLRLLAESGAFSSFLFTEAHPDAVEVVRANARTFPGAIVRAADARDVSARGPVRLRGPRPVRLADRVRIDRDPRPCGPAASSP